VSAAAGRLSEDDLRELARLLRVIDARWQAKRERERQQDQSRREAGDGDGDG